MEEFKFIDINGSDGNNSDNSNDENNDGGVSTYSVSDTVGEENTGLSVSDDNDDDNDDNDAEEIMPQIEKPMPSPSVARLVYSAYSDMTPSPKSKYAPAGLLTYIGMVILTSIPVIGLISAMVIALCAKRVAVHRFALAVVIVRTAFWAAAAVAAAIAVYGFHVDIFGSIFRFCEQFILVGNAV